MVRTLAPSPAIKHGGGKHVEGGKNGSTVLKMKSTAIKSDEVYGRKITILMHSDDISSRYQLKCTR
jgi:hypothetical protein